MKWFDQKTRMVAWPDDWIQVTNGKCVIEMTWLNYTTNSATLERKRTQTTSPELVLQCSWRAFIPPQREDDWPKENWK